MHNHNNESTKAKDFKNAMLRLLKELSPYKILIALSLTLAVMGSILAILAPNKLSDLTDEISKGLVINTTSMEVLTTKITDSFSEEKMTTLMPKLLSLDINNESIQKIMISSQISKDDKELFMNTLEDIKKDQSNLVLLTKLPDSILNIILPDTTYNDISITTKDKLSIIKLLDTESTNKNIPDSISSILFETIFINGVKIAPEEQTIFINKMGELDSDVAPKELYSVLDTMPESIKDVVKPVMNIEGIKNITTFLVVIYVLSSIFTYIESISMTDVSNKFAKKLRGYISTKINKLPLKYFDNHSTGDILSRVTNDVDTVAQSMNQSLATLVSSGVLFLGTILMMFYTNWVMAITAIVSSLIGFVFMGIILGKSQKYFIERQKSLGDLNGHIEEVYSGLNVVKAYNGSYLSDKKFDSFNDRVYNANRKSQFLSGLMMPIMNFIGNFGYVAVCIVGALLTMNDYITFGVIVAFMSYVRLFTSPLSQIAQAMTSLQSTAAASERVFEFIDEEEMSNEKNIKKTLNKKSVKGEIEFKDVTFKYDGNEDNTIKNFNALALPGQKVAIVGPTGAGKTTIVNLLMKFYDINSGDILIDGVSIHDITRENVHDLFTMVLQDTWLFDGSVKDNIIYNRKKLSDKDVENVCKTVGMHHFIKTLPHGYDSHISDNDSVSSGQRQLLTIARGMTLDTPFLILDEATSNVDTRTEELVQSAMDKLTQGKTSFIIAHRLSTIKNADLILVMKEGNIVEVGNHEDLMKQKGFYSELYNSQFEI